MEQGMVESRRNLKRNKIISAVRYHEDFSRHDVKKLTGYSMTTVLGITGELVERGLLEEEDCTQARTGRKPTWLHIRPQGAYAVGVEFNADALNCVVVDFSYGVVYSGREKISLDCSQELLLEKMKAAVRAALDSLGEESAKVLGIGLGLPGYVDRANGVGLEYAYLQAWKDVPVRAILEEAFGLRVLTENNIDTMAVAYRWRNYRETAEDFVFISMKYGIGMGLVIDNKLFTGGGHAGEIGHTRLQNSSRFCSCGRRGCLDTEVSFKAIRTKILERMESGQFASLRLATGGSAEKITMSLFSQAITQGDRDALDLLREVADFLGQGLGMVLGTLNPRRLIIGSNSGMGGEIFSDALYAAIRENANPILLQDFRVDCIRTPENLGAVGAALRVMEEEFQVVEEAV